MSISIAEMSAGDILKTYHFTGRSYLASLRLQVLYDYNYTCVYCGGYGDTVDHVKPRSKGGRNLRHNMVCACHLCNKLKDNLMPDEFDEFANNQKVSHLSKDYVIKAWKHLIAAKKKQNGLPPYHEKILSTLSLEVEAHGEENFGHLIKQFIVISADEMFEYRINTSRKSFYFEPVRELVKAEHAFEVLSSELAKVANSVFKQKKRVCSYRFIDDISPKGAKIVSIQFEEIVQGETIQHSKEMFRVDSKGYLLTFNCYLYDILDYIVEHTGKCMRINGKYVPLESSICYQ